MNKDSFDPEVIALLNEIGGDPDTSLLRLPKEPLIRWVGRPEEWVTSQGSHLTRAEKHLTEAYREEAAWVLLQACVMELKRAPLVFSMLSTSPQLLRLSATRLSSKATEYGCDGLDAISRGAELDAVRLGTAALRMSPGDYARNALAVALQRSGQNASSMHLLDRILSGVPSSTQRAQAFENMAQVWVTLGAYEKSLECNRKAAKVDESKIRFLVWCLTSAMQCGDEAEVKNFSSKLESHPRCQELPSLFEALVEGKSNAQWVPTPVGRVLASRVRDDLAESVREVCNVFA